MKTRSMGYRETLEDIVAPCIGASIVILNTIVIYYIIKYRKSHHNAIATVYMLNMAFGDFFVGLVMIIMKVVDIVLEQQDKSSYTHTSYQVIRDGLIRLSLFISVLNLIPLTIDRVWAVKYPISHRQSKKTLAVKICVAVWTVSILFVTSFYLIIHFQMQHTRFNKLIFPLATYPTILVFIVCYIVIFRELRNSRRYRERSGSRSASTMTRVVTNAVTNTLSLDSRSNSVISLSKFDERKSEVRFLQLAVKTVVIFIVCWFPIATCGIPFMECKQDVESTFMIFGYLNAAVTPLVYYSHIRHALKRKIRRLTSRKNTTPPTLSKSACTIFHSSNTTINTSVDNSPISRTQSLNIIAGVDTNNMLSVARSAGADSNMLSMARSA